MTDSRSPLDGLHRVPARPCGKQPTGIRDDAPRHPRPARVDLEMHGLYAVDYGVRDSNGRMKPMDLRPFLDAMAASYDHCSPCREYHVRAIAADPALTVHVVGVALCGFGHDIATARQLICKLDPHGAAIAVTIRNEGLIPAVKLAARIGADARESTAGIALNALVSAGWYDVPVSNLVPPAGRRPAVGLGDAELLADLREDGYLH